MCAKFCGGTRMNPPTNSYKAKVEDKGQLRCRKYQASPFLFVPGSNIKRQLQPLLCVRVFVCFYLTKSNRYKNSVEPMTPHRSSDHFAIETMTAPKPTLRRLKPRTVSFNNHETAIAVYYQIHRLGGRCVDCLFF